MSGMHYMALQTILHNGRKQSGKFFRQLFKGGASVPFFRIDLFRIGKVIKKCTA
jgi:hypothetical protein